MEVQKKYTTPITLYYKKNFVWYITIKILNMQNRGRIFKKLQGESPSKIQN